MKTVSLAVMTSVFCIAGSAQANQEITELARSMEQLPQSVARTLQAQLGDRVAEEIEEILFEGVPVLYEAEMSVLGREVDIAIWPDGQLVELPLQEEDDDDDAEADDDDDEDVVEREVTLDQLPAAAADVVRRMLGDLKAVEIEEISYEGIVVLYEVEVSGGVAADEGDEAEEAPDVVREFFVSPYGSIATQEGDIVERSVTMNDLPMAVANTMRRMLGDRRASELEEIRYEGIPILYEAEVNVEGVERDIAVFPNGQLAADGNGELEDVGEDLVEREVRLADLPRVVAQALQTHLKNGKITEVDEIIYDGITVLFEAETDDYEVAVYPDGQFAAGSANDGDDDEVDDEDDEDDDEGDDDEDDDDNDDDDDDEDEDD